MFFDARKVIIGECIFIIGATLVALSFVILPSEPNPLFVLQVLSTVLFGILGFILTVYGVIYIVTQGVFTRHLTSPRSFWLTAWAALFLGVAWVVLAWILAPWYQFPVDPECQLPNTLSWWYDWDLDRFIRCSAHHSLALEKLIFLSATTFLFSGCVQILLGFTFLIKFSEEHDRISK